jgi:hypothetical protein
MDPIRKSEPAGYEKKLAALREERRQEEARLHKLRARLVRAMQQTGQSPQAERAA